VCKLQHAAQVPSQGPDSNEASGDYQDSLDASAGGAGSPQAAPATRTEMQPTKFSKLLKVVLPMAQGGAIGAFGGNSKVPGSGFQASERYFGNQAELGLQKQRLQQSQQNDQFKNMLEYARAGHEASMAPFGGAQAGRTWQADVDGKPHVFRASPYSGNPEDLGEAPAPKATMRPVQTAQGMQSFETTGPEPGKTTPLTTPPSQQPDNPMLVSNPGVPLEPPTRAAQPKKETSRDKTGKESDYYIDPQSGKRTTDQPGATREPRPRAARATQAKPDQGLVESAAESFMQSVPKGATDDQIESALASVKADPALKAAVREQIRKMKKPLQPGKKNYLQGIDTNALTQPAPVR
jgi:hypothetical protein